MEVIGLLSGGAPVIRRYQVAATVSNVGIPLLVAAAGGAGLALGTATGATDMVGINLDTVTYTTTQGTGENSAERTVKVVINPDAILRARMSGGATSGTALAIQENTTANTAGTIITTGAEWSSPTYDEGSAWGYSGANAGQVRKVTSVSGTAGTVTVPFDNDLAVGDEFLRAPYNPMQTITVQLTTDLTEANAAIAVGTGAPFNVIGLETGDQAEEGTLKSYVVMTAKDHFLSSIA